METALQIQTALRSHSVPVPSQTWLLSLVQAQSQATLGALIMTARTRILACDLTTPNLLDSAYLSAHTFPIQITSPAATNINEIRLNRDVVVQILDIENLSRSRWDQVEELESIERGEQTRGRQVIRLPTTNNDDEEDNQAPDLGDASDTQQLNTQRTAGGTEGAIQAVARERERQARNATHKLVLQDAKGKKMFGLELKRMDRIMVGTTCMGEKLLLKTGMMVARGVLLLEPGNCQILGGKVEAWHKEWTEGRLARLREAVGADVR
ncbi:putative mediated genome instability protein rmi1 protein [Rhypophila decipiens]|uniref:RecQ-mediated genome instability protein 1 n=1 Tax=Rhypophila decipiens TaxID=261697 RepID=A0AAN6YGQ3_9PEZI|nr:putative mediated genome instability protein rmi1 protein [Rhypophila decipiens]